MSGGFTLGNDPFLQNLLQPQHLIAPNGHEVAGPPDDIGLQLQNLGGSHAQGPPDDIEYFMQELRGTIEGPPGVIEPKHHLQEL